MRVTFQNIRYLYLALFTKQRFICRIGKIQIVFIGDLGFIQTVKPVFILLLLLHLFLLGIQRIGISHLFRKSAALIFLFVYYPAKAFFTFLIIHPADYFSLHLKKFKKLALIILIGNGSRSFCTDHTRRMGLIDYLGYTALTDGDQISDQCQTEVKKLLLARSQHPVRRQHMCSCSGTVL